jgi:cell volume regulation protein A
VLISATLQGWTLPTLAARLGLEEPAPAPPAASLEILSLRDVNAEIIDVVVSPGSPIAGRTVEELALPQTAIVAMLSRGRTLIAPRGGTRLEAGDHLFVIAQPADRAAVDRALAASG